MAHPAWFGGPKTPEQQKETLATGLKLAFAVGAVMIIIALVQDYFTDQLKRLMRFTPTSASSEWVVENDTTEN
jgi:hypothetical protein